MESIPSINPVLCFALQFDCKEMSEKGWEERSSAFLIPDTSQIIGENGFSSLWMAWKKEGLYFQMLSEDPFKKASYPEIQKGDSLELFIDTRNVKSSGFNTRFCHHFFFLSEAIDGQQAGELTRFRGEERHPLCNPDALKVVVEKRTTSYLLECMIPKECLVGFDPEQFNQLGFTYRINRFKGKPQHFSVHSADYKIEEQPSLWAEVLLV